MFNFLKNDHLFNRWTHIIFPARSLNKEYIYWPCEIAAAIVMFVYILQVETTPQLLYYGREGQVIGHRYLLTLNPNNQTYERSFATSGDGNITWGIRNVDLDYRNSAATSANNNMMMSNVFRIGYYNTDLINREYAWICLCWIIKYFFYTVEAVYFMVAKKMSVKPHVKPWDIATPILMLILWILWGAYGWDAEGDEIFAGMYERFQKDTVLNVPIMSEDALKFRHAYIKRLVMVYEEMAKRWKWLFIPTVIIGCFNLMLFILGLVQKRSSAYTGQAVSTVAIPFQLFFLHLFLKGAWQMSNAAFLNRNVSLSVNQMGATSSSSTLMTFTSYEAAVAFAQNDYFEARWTFWIIYLSAWAGLGFSVICFFKSMKEFGHCRLNGFKYLCYCVFWVVCFIWVVCMDNTLYHYYYQYGTALAATMIIAFVCVFFIAIISIKQKDNECYGFYDRHNRFYEWHEENFATTYPRYTDNLGCKRGCSCKQCKGGAKESQNKPEETKPLQSKENQPLQSKDVNPAAPN